jgi:hypothetical protein
LLSNSDKNIIIFNFKNKREGIVYNYFLASLTEKELIVESVGSATINFSIITATLFTAPLTANSQGVSTMDFIAAVAQKVNLTANGKGTSTLNFTSAFYKKQLTASSVGLATLNFSVQKDQVVQLTATANSNAFFTSTDLQFEKQWVFKSVGAPYQVVIDLGEVQACPTISEAQTILNQQFPASNQNFGDKAFVGNAFTIDPNTFDIFICQDHTFEVEAV